MDQTASHHNAVVKFDYLEDSDLNNLFRHPNGHRAVLDALLRNALSRTSSLRVEPPFY